MGQSLWLAKKPNHTSLLIVFGEDTSYIQVQTEFHIISSLNFIEITV
jgi:hypothetical protein